MKAQKYTATIIGLIFSAVCFFGTFTFALPIFFLIPTSVALEWLLGQMLGDITYSTLGTTIIFVLTAIFLCASLIYYRALRRQASKVLPFRRDHLLLFFTFNLFIIHPLFFYLHASKNWRSAGDGQFIFGVIETFPVSSLVFFFMGWLIDALKNNLRVQQVESVNKTRH